jgi:pimeloyl-ACP methyl ester carboxylesterase
MTTVAAWRRPLGAAAQEVHAADLGGLDARSPLSVACRFEQAIPDARLVVISSAGHMSDPGHMSNLEQPERFNRAVRGFCREPSPHSP